MVVLRIDALYVAARVDPTAPRLFRAALETADRR
jgi:hypothetical protein